MSTVVVDWDRFLDATADKQAKIIHRVLAFASVLSKQDAPKLATSPKKMLAISTTLQGLQREQKIRPYAREYFQDYFFDLFSFYKGQKQAKTPEKFGEMEFGMNSNHIVFSTSYEDLDIIFDYMAKNTSVRSLLDIGCHVGRIGFYLSLMHPQIDYTGVEIIQDRADFATQKAKDFCLKNTRFFCKDIFDNMDMIGPGRCPACQRSLSRETGH